MSLSLFTIFFFLLHLVSIVITALALRSLYAYIRKFRFEQSQYELLFGFVHLRHVAAMYVLLTIALVAYSTSLLFRYYG